MNIGVNVRRLEGQRLGVGRYLEYLLRAWVDGVRPDERMSLYLRAPLCPDDDWIARRFDTRVLGPRLTGIAWENVSMCPRLRDLDVFFGPSYTLPLGYRGRCVVATHSLNETTPGAHPWWYHYTYSALYRASARKALKVIVPSPSVLGKVHTHYGVPHSRLEIVREGAPDDFAPVTDQETLRRTRLDFTGSEVPYILFVGKFSERRNIPLLIRAFAELTQRAPIPHNLLLLGPNHLNLPLAALAQQVGVADRVIITNRSFARHADIVPVFSAAELYAFPSLFEGASNTVVEAMSCGVPVVAGRCEAIADIVEGCGTLLDPVTVDSLADAMRAALTDRGRWQEMRELGLERSRGLRWSSTAAKTLEIVRWAGSGAA
ncbi:MAG: glycosyltransferase family 1 protein [Gemmatimonadales bacterium]|nr:glycosyltransferase family 1 protein [Gemmatimonadales bacterium]